MQESRELLYPLGACSTPGSPSARACGQWYGKARTHVEDRGMPHRRRVVGALEHVEWLYEAEGWLWSRPEYIFWKKPVAPLPLVDHAELSLSAHSGPRLPLETGK